MYYYSLIKTLAQSAINLKLFSVVENDAVQKIKKLDFSPFIGLSQQQFFRVAVG